MKVQMKQLIVVLAVVIVVLGGIYFFLTRDRMEKNRLVDVVQPEISGPQKGEKGYNETETRVTVGTKEVQAGGFDRVEAGKIYYKTNDGFTIESELTSDQVVLSCYTGELSGVGQIDYAYVTDVKVYTPGTIGAVILRGEPMVALASADATGSYKTNTIVIDASKCPK
ncbi:MAG: hypothetical protein US53_C0037G0004 [Candidatus Woesebacteria bacterium GW2011_GWA1_37_7]|uniref:Uncharacterized protein n=1 Tax=Candidatus Woesebacteria bacterium GW2011_GWA1_37_7 TaxID=1618545 RepID=A0A0G0K852_9BACT|nr:MAG: hypothetical protein US53_C0037G0004 [Candidatus Woesebacteria bacterium GW2011_GWA1_37_7]